MELPDFIQLNFHAISSSTAAAFTLFASLFFLITVPRRSAATVHLGLGLLFVGIANLAYVFTATVYHPVAAFHRYLTVSFIPLATIHFGHFFWNFPRNPNRKLSRRVLMVQWAATIILTGLFIYDTLNGERWFRFSAHYWDFAEWEMSSHIANLITLFVLMVPGIAIYKMVRNDRGLRWTIFWLMLAFLAGTLIPAVANKLSHAGKMSRGNFQVLYNLMTILGFFAMIIIYINKTLDRTTFMAKIVGISLVTILVIFQWLSYASYVQSEGAYDSLHRKDMELSMVTDKRSEDLVYLIRFAEGKQNFVYSRSEGTLPAYNTERFHVLQAYEQLKQEGNLPPLQRSGSESPVWSAAYFQALRRWSSDDEQNYSSRFQQLQDQLRIRRIQIRKIPNSQFEESVHKHLSQWAGEDGIVQPFDERALQSFLKSIRASDRSTENKKEELLKHYLEVYPDGKRYYRSHPEFGHLICFAMPGRDGGYYEAGYSYLSYRSEQMQVAVAEMWMLLGCLVIVLLGFRVFFLRTLIDPLQALLSGVQNLNSGDLNIRVPVKVQDEIGFLTGSFNRMVTSIRRARGQLQEYANTLEDRVQERTLELEATVQRIQEMKNRQDGDFFLTSLLIHPLSSNQVRSDHLDTETLLLQKKTFAFRRWKGEIGGDFCSTHTISLRGKRYVVFLNGDAMGKSLQGAAGALILGSVFESIVQRTELSQEIQSLYPEMWLRDAYLELQKIFCTFDGYMMASMVLGLVEEDTGYLFFLNAEHPWPVLYRDNRAFFPVVEEEKIIHKLGIPLAEQSLRIYTLQLRIGDIFISGSDGRDDLILGRDEEGNRIYNMEESQFLQVVEEAKGDLASIVECLKKRGELSDDLSLLRLQLLQKRPSAELPTLIGPAEKSRESSSGNSVLRGHSEEMANQLEEIHREMVGNHKPVPDELYRRWFEIRFRKQDYERAGSVAEEWMAASTIPERYLYLASYAFKRTGRIEEARIQAERMLLRNPGHANNLVNLADIYRMLGMLEKAEECVTRALKIRPGHKSAELIRNTLNNLRQEL